MFILLLIIWNLLPEIYCEANDLLGIPSFEVDPVYFRSTYSSALQSQLPFKSKFDSSVKSNTSKSIVSSSRMPRVIDRSSNIGLPEGDSLADLKEVVNRILQHTSGCAVNFNFTVLVAVTQQMFLALYLLHLHLHLF